MYATVIQSLTSQGQERQTAVVARANGTVISYSRIAGGRGRAGAWGEVTADDITSPEVAAEKVLGMPSTVKVTATDETALNEPNPKPTVLWQKLARVAASEDFGTTQKLGSTYTAILAYAEEDPRRLAQYLGGSAETPESVLAKVREVVPTAADIAAHQTTQAAGVPTQAVIGVPVQITPGSLDHTPTAADAEQEGDAFVKQGQAWLAQFRDDNGRDATTEEFMSATISGEVKRAYTVVAQTPTSGPVVIAEVEHHDVSDDDDTPLAFASDASESDMFEDSDDDEDGTALFDSVDDLLNWVEEQDEEPEAAAPAPAAVVTPGPAESAPVVRTTDEEEPLLMTPAHVGAGGHIPQRSELAPLVIPSPADVESYVERTLPGGKTETEVLDFARANQHAVAIFGHSGTGKTSSARNYAAQRGLPFVPFECNPQTDEEVVQGTYIPTGNGTELAWRYSQLATAIQRPSVILLNESNRMSAKANALFLHLLQERELIVSRHKNEVIPVHPEVLFITDANPGYAGTTKHDQAFLDRFAITLEYAYDREVEKHFIPSKHLLDLATQMREQAEREDRYRDTPVSTRLLVNFVEQAKGLGMEFAIASFLAAFSADERDALRMVVDVYAVRIAEDLGLADPDAAEQDEDDLSDAFAVSNEYSF